MGSNQPKGTNVSRNYRARQHFFGRCDRGKPDRLRRLGDRSAAAKSDKTHNDNAARGSKRLRNSQHLTPLRVGVVPALCRSAPTPGASDKTRPASFRLNGGRKGFRFVGYGKSGVKAGSSFG
jgi:hypothetical protein